MRRICWWVVDIASRLLDTREREAICGDFAESGETGGQALRDAMGLVARRQAAVWAHWRPWLTLVGLIIPLGMLLSIISRRAADGSAIYVWLYANNWQWGDLGNAGFRYELVHCAPMILRVYATLACGAWTSGFVLGWISGRTIRLNWTLFCLILCFGALLGAPLCLELYSQYLHRAFSLPSLPDLNAPVFAVTFYRVTFPLIVQIVLVVGPSLSGMNQGAEVATFRPWLRTILWTAVVATLAGMVVQNPDLWLLLTLYRRVSVNIWLLQILKIIVYWPLGYLAARSAWKVWAGNQRGLKHSITS